MPNLKSIKQIFRTIHRLPQPAFPPLEPMPAYGHEKNNLHCTFILVAQHHATVVHTHRQSRIFFLKDTNQINEVSPSLQMGTFDKVSTRYCLRTAQMHKVVRLANFLASSRVSFCSPALNEPAQKVRPLWGLSTALSIQAISASSVTMRGNPNT